MSYDQEIPNVEVDIQAPPTVSFETILWSCAMVAIYAILVFYGLPE